MPKVFLSRSLVALLALVPTLAAAAPIEISGRVLDERELPIAGAEVALAAVPDPAEAARLELDGRSAPAPAARARSGADGGFRLEAPGVGLYTLRAAAEGRVALVWPRLPLVETLELEPARLPRDLGARVEVVDEQGRPLAGARVRLRLDPSGGSRARGARNWSVAEQAGVTDSAGRLTLSRAEGSAYELIAVGAGRPPVAVAGWRDGRARLVLPAGVEREVEARVGEGPAAGAAIWLERPRLALALADASGWATLALPKGGELAVVLTGPAHSAGRATVRRAGEPSAPPQRIALEPARRVAGRVIDATTRAPIAAALVYDGGDSGAWTSSVAAGFALELPRAAAGPLGAAARGYLTQSPAGDRLEPAATAAPTLALEPAAAIEGVVVDGGGAPVAGAEVRATVFDRNPSGWMRSVGAVAAAFSDARGAFRLRGLVAARGWRLTARRAGYGPGEATVERLVAGGTARGVRIELPPQGELYGVVLGLDERPVAGAELELSPAIARDLRIRMLGRGRAAYPDPRATTDAEGRFAFAGLGAGSFDLTVEAAGFAPMRVPRIEIVKGEPRDLGEILLDEGVAIEGRVVDRDGEPVAGAEILASEDLAMRAVFGNFDGLEPAATSDDAGRFLLPDRRRGARVDLVARRSGFAPGTVAAVVAPTESPVRIVLERMGRISGRVLDEAGRPAEASVSARVLRRAQSAAGRAAAGMIDSGEVATDADGEFELADVLDGVVTVSARGTRGERAEKEGLELAPGASIAGVELRFAAGARVAGHVLDPEGRPLPDVWVEVTAPGGTGWGGAGAETDGDGRFLVAGVGPGRYTVGAEQRPYRAAQRDIEIGPELGDVEVELRLGAGPTVRGVVVDEQGAGAAEAMVLMMTAGTQGGGRVWSVSGPDGAFEIEGAEPGRYRLTAEKAGYSPAELAEPLVVDAADVEGVQLRLTRGGTIAGRVLGLEFGDLADVRVDGRSARARAAGAPDYEGRYRLEGLAAGEWSVVAELSRAGRRAAGRATVPESGGEVELDLEFGKGLVLAGEVLWRGAPAPGAAVSATDAGRGERVAGVTDQTGRFRLEGLTEGRYEVLASDAAGRAWARETVDLGGDREIRLELGSARVEGEVRSARDETPIRGARVRIEPIGDPAASFTRISWLDEGTGDDGRYARDGIGLGEQRVTVAAEGFAAAERRITIADRDQVERVDFRLEPNEGVTLRVLGPNGLPPQYLWVAALDAGGNSPWSDMVAPGEGGLVRLTSLPPGEWTLLVGGYQMPVVRKSVVSPGDAGEVRLPEPGQLRVRVPALGAGEGATVRLLGADGFPYLYPRGGRPWSEFPMLDGDLTLGGLPPGAWTVEATAPDGRRWRGAANVVPSGEVTVTLE